MKETIQALIVDNRELVRKKIAKAIKSNPQIQIVDFASNGYEAITKTMQLHPNVVVMNAGMETRMAGVFACKEISINAPNTKVILYNESVEKDIVYKAFQMGAVNLLTGDYLDSDLVAAVVDAFDGRSSIHHSAAAILSMEFKRVLNLQDNLIYVVNVAIRLTPAELNILKLMYNGMHYCEVAKVLFISTTTMKTHISHILKKFNLESTAQVLEVLRSTELFSIIHITSSEL